MDENITKFKFTVSITRPYADNGDKQFVDNDIWLTREEFYDLVAQLKDKKTP